MTRRGFLALLAPFTALLSGCASLLSPALRQHEVEKSWRRFYGHRHEWHREPERDDLLCPCGATLDPDKMTVEDGRDVLAAHLRRSPSWGDAERTDLATAFLANPEAARVELHRGWLSRYRTIIIVADIGKPQKLGIRVLYAPRPA